MVELSAVDDRVLGLPLRLGLAERLPPALLAFELESLLAFTAASALATGVGYWPAYAFPLTLFGLVVAALSTDAPRGPGAVRSLVYFGYMELGTILLDICWLLAHPEKDASTSRYASFAVGLTMCLKLVLLVKVAERLQEAGQLGVPPGGDAGLPGPGGSGLPGSFPAPSTRTTAGYEAFLPPHDGPGYRDGGHTYDYDAEALDSNPTTMFDSSSPASAGPHDAQAVKLPSP